MCWTWSVIPAWDTLSAADRSVEEVLRELQENHQKYKHIEQDILQRKRRLLYKEPEIQKALAAVNMLLQRKEEEEAVSTSCNSTLALG